MATVGAVIALTVVAGQVAVAWWIGKTKGLCWLGYLWLTLWLGGTHPADFGNFLGGILVWFGAGMGLYTATAWTKQTEDQRFSLLLGVAIISVTGLAIYLLL